MFFKNVYGINYSFPALSSNAPLALLMLRLAHTAKGRVRRARQSCSLATMTPVNKLLLLSPVALHQCGCRCARRMWLLFTGETRKCVVCFLKTLDFRNTFGLSCCRASFFIRCVTSECCDVVTRVIMTVTWEGQMMFVRVTGLCFYVRVTPTHGSLRRRTKILPSRCACVCVCVQCADVMLSCVWWCDDVCTDLCIGHVWTCM